MVEVLEEDESRVRWSHDNGKTWKYADIDELIEAYEKEREQARETERTCEFCYYRDFDENAYPCSRCIRNESTKNMCKPKELDHEHID